MQEPREQALQYGAVDIARALGCQDKAYAVMTPDPGDLAKDLGSHNMIVIRGYKVELVDGKHNKRNLVALCQPLEIARDGSYDQTEVGDQQATAIDVDNRTGF